MAHWTQVSDRCLLGYLFLKLMYIFAVLMLPQHMSYYTCIYKGKGKLDLMNTYDNYFGFSMFDARFSVKKTGFRDSHVTVNTAIFFRLNSVGWAIKSQQTNKHVHHE